LAAVVFTPLYFNVYSSRVFEPDKISMLRNIVLLMVLAWLIKLSEQLWLRLRQPPAAVAASGTRRRGAAEAAPAPSPAQRIFNVLKVPLILPILLYAALYVFASTPLVSIVPLTSVFGSY